MPDLDYLTAGPSTSSAVGEPISFEASPVVTSWRVSAAPAERPGVHSPDDAALLLAPFLEDLDRERCVALFLDTKHRLLQVSLVAVGSIDRTFMAPREVLRDALLANAATMVLAHNHPSGDPEPSNDDIVVAKRLARAGEVVGVDLLDALVFCTATRWTSLARRGVLG